MFLDWLVDAGHLTRSQADKISKAKEFRRAYRTMLNALASRPLTDGDSND